MRGICRFVLVFGVWMLLVWPFERGTGSIRIQDAAVGVGVALIAAVVMRGTRGEERTVLLGPVRLFWLAVYAVVLAWYIVKANVDVAYRVLHPAMPIRPGIVKVRTNLKTASAVTALANSITLTPGTLTVGPGADGVLYVHWIYVRTLDSEEATARIVGRFEWFLKRIFE